MDLELEDIFQWQTPLCTLSDIGSVDGMVMDIDLPELIQDHSTLSIGDTAAVADHSTPTTCNPVSSPLWPCNSPHLAPDSVSVAVFTDTPAARFTNTQPEQIAPSFDRALISPQSSAPFKQPASKPKRSRTTRSPKTEKPALEAEEAKETRVPTQAEHIIRERQRRDDMAAKYLILESLLPPAPKRERAVVVDDAMSFVKTLKQKRGELLKRRAELRLATPWRGSSEGKTRTLVPLHDFSGPDVVVPTSSRKQSVENCRTECGSGSPSSSSDVVAQERFQITSNRGSSSTISAINVHIAEDDVVMEMVWSEPHPNFQSKLLQTVESLGLDVSRCSILRLTRGFIQCIITSSKQTTETQLSATLIVSALRNVLSKT